MGNDVETDVILANAKPLGVFPRNIFPAIENVAIELLGTFDDVPAPVVAELKTGEFFGEQALMPDSKGKRNAFVRANEKTRMIKIPKEYFRLILSRDEKISAELKGIQESR